MTNKEIAEQLRELSDKEIMNDTTRRKLWGIAEKIHPSWRVAGTVVWFPIDDEYGIVDSTEKGVLNADGELIPWDELQEGTKPVRILLDEV